MLQEQAKKKLELQASPEEVKVSRLTPQRIRLMRNKIGISQKDLGTLAGCEHRRRGDVGERKVFPFGEKEGGFDCPAKIGEAGSQEASRRKETGTEGKGRQEDGQKAGPKKGRGGKEKECASQTGPEKIVGFLQLEKLGAEGCLFETSAFPQPLFFVRRRKDGFVKSSRSKARKTTEE